jgi:hypothetical protein
MKGSPMNYYKFDWETKQVVPSEERMERSEQIALTYLDGVEIRVSTVFLSSDHGFGLSNKPIVFETMVFGGAFDDWCERRSDYDAAMICHEDAVRMASAFSLWHSARSILHRTQVEFPPSYPIEVGAHALADKAAHLWPEALRILRELPTIQRNINDLLAKQRQMLDMQERHIAKLEREAGGHKW